MVNASRPVRVCIYGAAPAPQWRAALVLGLPAGTPMESYDVADPASALQLAAARFPGADLIVLRAGTTLPPFWFERLVPALQSPDVLVTTPLDNTDAERAPLPAGMRSDADPQRIDAACWRYSRRLAIPVSSFSACLSAWNGAALARIDPACIVDGTLPAALAPLRCVLLDHLYVADPACALRGPDLPKPNGVRPVSSPLGELREAVHAALDAATDVAAYPGLDPRPVVLHVLHGWGGGTERFVRDLAATDRARHHLALVARGPFARRRYGEIIELHDAATIGLPWRRVELSDPITSTALAHRAYRAFLDSILRDFRVDAVFVSSLIGHGLDALRTGLPTTYFIHDFYPLWPLLHGNLDETGIAFDAARLRSDLADAGDGFEFAERDVDWWLTLREAFVEATLAARVRLLAASRSALATFLKLQPRLRALAHQVIAHGIAPWPDTTPIPLPAPPLRARIRLLILGRVRGGKAANLLRRVLPQLRDAELFLMGAGPEANEFFGHPNIHILLNYAAHDLPALLARIAPDLALMLADIPETFSYTLSELRSLGIPVLATRLGAPAERIADGVDGFLVAADATAIATAIAQLRAEPERLARVRTELARRSPRLLADMAVEHGALLPAVARTPGAAHPAIADSAEVAAQQYAGQLGATQRELARIERELVDKQHELDRRAAWATDLDAQLKRSAGQTKALQSELQTAQRWARDANKNAQDAHAQTRRAAENLSALQSEFDDRTRWAQSLDAELAAMRTSTSWRITKPLRHVKRKLRALYVRLRYIADRMRANVHRTRGSLASRGVTGTIRRAADEFRRAAPIEPRAVAVPSEEFAPFAVPRAATPKVSIVIPVFNKIAYTAACLRSLAVHAGTVAFEAIVVDDASCDATAEHLAQVEGLRVVRNAQNLGFVGSCNAGAAQARGEFIVLLNNDTVVTAGWLDALIRCFEEQPDCGLVGAKLVYPDGRLQEAGGIVFADASGWNYGRFEDPSDPRFNFRREADYCSGAAIMLRRELFETLGGFDARYAPAYYEDTDLAFAVRAAGKKVFYEPRAVVVHFEGITAGTDTGSGMKRFQTINRDKFALKWKDALARQPAPIRDAGKAEAAANFRAHGHVLIVDAYTPTPDQDSGSLRMLNLMRLLRESGYAVSFLPDNRAHADAYTHAVQALGVQALYHPFTSDPVAWLRTHGPTLDAVVLSRHYVAAKYVGPVRLYAPQARLIFDTVDVHHLREQRAAELEGSAELAQQAQRTRAQELKLMRECDVTLVVSAMEQQLLTRELPHARIEVLSNVHAVYGRRREFDARRDLVFVGGFQHPPNIDAVLWFVREVFPRVRAQLPDVMFHVIGSKAPRQILDLAHDGVTVHGFVADIEPFMDGSRLSIAPLRYGAGVKGKINMAMSYGLPVVATTPAAEGMHARNGVDLLVADSPEDFAVAIARAYTDAALWEKLSDNGLANVRAHFSFDAARAALARILPPRPSRAKPASG